MVLQENDKCYIPFELLLDDLIDKAGNGRSSTTTVDLWKVLEKEDEDNRLKLCVLIQAPSLDLLVCSTIYIYICYVFMAPENLVYLSKRTYQVQCKM